MADRPFQPAIAPMNTAIRTFEFVGDAVKLSHSLSDPLVIRGYRGNTAHPLDPGVQPFELTGVYSHCFCARYVTDCCQIGQRHFTTKEIRFAEFAFEYGEQLPQFVGCRPLNRWRFRGVLRNCPSQKPNPAASKLRSQRSSIMRIRARS